MRDDPAAPLRTWPNPDGTGAGGPPYSIRLAAWAVDVAAELDGQFGSDVEMLVGFLHYPLAAVESQAYRIAVTDHAEGAACPEEIAAEPAGPVTVRSGHDVRTTLVVRNNGQATTRIRTNGAVTAAIVDPSTHRVVGGFAGAQVMPLVVFELAPGSDVHIPLVVGTASLDPHLGFAVPPGEWAYTVELDLDPGGPCRLPEAPVTIRP